jgi:hypothetical protein
MAKCRPKSTTFGIWGFKNSQELKTPFNKNTCFNQNTHDARPFVTRLTF